MIRPPLSAFEWILIKWSQSIWSRWEPFPDCLYVQVFHFWEPLSNTKRAKKQFCWRQNLCLESLFVSATPLSVSRVAYYSPGKSGPPLLHSPSSEKHQFHSSSDLRATTSDGTFQPVHSILGAQSHPKARQVRPPAPENCKVEWIENKTVERTQNFHGWTNIEKKSRNFHGWIQQKVTK